MPKIIHNRAFPYENDEFDILVGTRNKTDPATKMTRLTVLTKKRGQRHH